MHQILKMVKALLVMANPKTTAKDHVTVAMETAQWRKQKMDQVTQKVDRSNVLLKVLIFFILFQVLKSNKIYSMDKLVCFILFNLTDVYKKLCIAH